MKETWKDVVGYEGRYEVSDCGRVRSIPRYVNNHNGNRKTANGYRWEYAEGEKERGPT